ncbi:MAG: ATP-dependent DNA helicase RecG [Alphaproteobacteria bacterium]|nr:ATP-dependent DNA helicase RecG [Alphaproteobacteria bacterium]MBL6939320.1 ATP-dependent DNA helicase RecG [Alphaproteobacteria bacterium]MBL7097199.1 ATP-dependent DNA helicase RecG [Alphaproteobacteria bacterium]
MRPSILFPFFAEIRTLAGVGPKVERLIQRVAGPRLVDLMFDLPTGLIDRSYRPKLAEAELGRIVTVNVNVLSHKPSRDRRQPYRVIVSDDTSLLELAFFHAHADYLKRQLPEGSRRIISGKLERFRDTLQMTHPDHIVAPEDDSGLTLHEPIYALTEGLTLKVLSKAIRAALDNVVLLPEWDDPAFFAKQGWHAWHEALLEAHAPQSDADLSPETPVRKRLAYDELLANQLALLLIRRQMRQAKKGRALPGDGSLKARAIAALPFALTAPQLQAIAEIEADIAAPTRMLRLLQGDVGSGKTIVAFLALLNAVEASAQGAFMAPTEILARQHMASLEPYAKATDIRLGLLTGRERATRETTLAALAAGEIDILIGTHALFTEDVEFADLGLAVIDEQHKFGVHQRMLLQGKGGRPVDVLVMTATPIPRTLALTAYGDMDVSRLMGRPPGRQPIATRTLSDERLDEVIEHLRKAIATGARAYWVCPLVEESEFVDLAAAEERAAMLKRVLGLKIGLVHGKMKGTERDAEMARFKAGETSILVATTVIEVGVDVPEATIMVVEHAERFGLAQLHQLRGRVGRGSGKSSCLLIYHGPLGETAKARLNTMRETDDGFVIAEKDLELRGAGELLGTRQSGMVEFRVADLAVHGDLLAAARDDAQLILTRDPELQSERGQALRTLLYLFGRDEAVRYLKAG